MTTKTRKTKTTAAKLEQLRAAMLAFHGESHGALAQIRTATLDILEAMKDDGDSPFFEFGDNRTTLRELEEALDQALCCMSNLYEPYLPPAKARATIPNPTDLLEEDEAE